MSTVRFTAGSFLKKILAMSVDKKVIVDQNVSALVQSLKSAGLTHVWDISKLKLDANKSSDDEEIKRRIVRLTAKTPNSKILFITANEHFRNPVGYDVLVVPGQFTEVDLVNSIKSWIITVPKDSQDTVFIARKNVSKFGYGYNIRIKKNDDPA